LPWNDGAFDLIVVSTVFSSILDPLVKRVLADEIERVLAPNGVVIWYDLAFDNPANPNVRGIKRKEIAELFQSLDCELRRVTLAPPIARLIVPISAGLGAVMEKIPFLRSHLLGVLRKIDR
jgi:SAM-dependent methyltransferase